MLADRICVMRDGEALQVGKPNDIYYRPADEFVAGFIGETNLLEVEVTRGAAGCDPLSRAGDRRCRRHPVARADGGGPSGRGRPS